MSDQERGFEYMPTYPSLLREKLILHYISWDLIKLLKR